MCSSESMQKRFSSCVCVGVCVCLCVLFVGNNVVVMSGYKYFLKQIEHFPSQSRSHSIRVGSFIAALRNRKQHISPHMTGLNILRCFPLYLITAYPLRKFSVSVGHSCNAYLIIWIWIDYKYQAKWLLFSSRHQVNMINISVVVLFLSII